jgi:hypothetical protein
MLIPRCGEYDPQSGERQGRACVYCESKNDCTAARQNGGTSAL